MNKIKRITAMFMVILTLFSSLSMMTVNAATEGTKTTIDASYRCYKGSDVGTSGTAPIGNKNYYWHYNADSTALNCPIRFLKEAGTGLAVYCIEVGATFNGYTYDTKILTDSPYWNSLSYTAKTETFESSAEFAPIIPARSLPDGGFYFLLSDSLSRRGNLCASQLFQGCRSEDTQQQNDVRQRQTRH